MKKRYVQKTLTMILTAAMICSSVPVAAETVSENEIIETVDTVTEQETVDMEEETDTADIEENLVSGKEGALSYSIYSNNGRNYVMITDCDESAKGAIVIPGEIRGIAVTSIGQEAFIGCIGITDITIPEGVTSIGPWAFTNCRGLTGIEIPGNVTSIGQGTFEGCSGLTSIEISEGVMSIGWGAFAHCSGLTSITIPGSVTSIGESAFYGCEGLTSIDIPEGVTDIEFQTFKGCSGLTSITIPESVTSIGVEAFSGCSGLTSIEISKGVTSIRKWAFAHCSGLTGITIPESVTSIGAAAFYGCSGLTSIEIPKSVTRIDSDMGLSMLARCSGLTNITVEAGNNVYDSRGNCNAIIEKKTQKLIAGCQNTVIPESVTSIGGGAFSCRSGLTSIEIPKGVTSIEYAAFYGCSGLTSIEIPEGVTSIEGSAFEDCIGLTDVYYAGTQKQWDTIEMGENVFTYYKNDQYFPLSYTLHCNDATEKPSASPSPEPSASPSPEPSAVPSHKPSAAPSKVPTAGIKLKKTGREYKVTGYSPSGNKKYVTITKLSAKDKKAKKLTIPKTITIKNVKYQVTGIAENTFKNNKKLRTVVIPDTVTEIGAGSFEGCKNLKSITIGKNVTFIGKNAFKNCKKLKKIIVESTKLEIVEEGAFTGVSKKCVIKVPKEQVKSYRILFKGKFSGHKSSATPSKAPKADTPTAEIKLKEGTGREYKVIKSKSSKSKLSVTITKLSADDKKAKKLTIPKTVTINNVKYKVTGIAAKAFKNCVNLQTVVIPDTVKKIGAGSFEGCKNLKSITIGKSVTSIGKNAFKSCEKLKKVTVKGTKLKKVGKDAFTGVNENCVIKVPEKQLKTYENLFKGTSSDRKASVTAKNPSSKDKKTKKVIIPKTVTIDNVEYRSTGIAPKAFKNKKNLQSVVISDTITKIGTSSFESCKNLERITIGKNVTSIGKNAFKNCKNLKKITVKSTKLKKVGKGAFTGINAKCVIKVPKKQQKSYKSLFKGKGQEKTVKITK